MVASFPDFRRYLHAKAVALGHGAGVFVFDTLKWSGGRVNGYALTGNVIAPEVILAVAAGVIGGRQRRRLDCDTADGRGLGLRHARVRAKSRLDDAHGRRDGANHAERQ